MNIEKCISSFNGSCTCDHCGDFASPCDGTDVTCACRRVATVATEETVAEPTVLETVQKCRFCDERGICNNPANNGGGVHCYECALAEPITVPATLTQGTFAVTMRHRTVQLPMAQALSFQYQKVGKAAGAAVREMVVFGAMLEKVDDSLTKARYNNSENENGQGVSLKSWLENNCPEINYQTAKSYQRAAEGVRVLVNMAADVPLLPLMGAEPIADEAMRKVREDVLGVISTSSLNVLRRAALPMPVGNKLKGTHGLAHGRRALTAEENAAEAEKTMRELVGSVGAYLRGPWFGMLTEQSQGDFLGALRHYAETVEDRMREAAMSR